MAVYAIGDVQGCYTELMLLLERIDFDEKRDQLWFAGDLVNRGNDSLHVLRFIKSLQHSQHTVLGNHDLHLLAVAAGVKPLGKEDTIQEILLASDREELLDWLAKQSLLYHDAQLNYVMVHAGFPPQWDLGLAMACAREVEIILHGMQCTELLRHIYGDYPDKWQPELLGWERYRFIINSLTRIRYCDAEGRLHLREKNAERAQVKQLIPWFKMPGRKTQGVNIIFGHWAALQGVTDEQNVYALDTGCVWGGRLTAMRLSDQKRITVESKNKKAFFS